MPEVIRAALVAAINAVCRLHDRAVCAFANLTDSDDQENDQ